MVRCGTRWAASVRQAMIPPAPARIPLHAVQMFLDGSQQDFPVVTGNQVVGVLTRADLLAALASQPGGLGDGRHAAGVQWPMPPRCWRVPSPACRPVSTTLPVLRMATWPASSP